MKIDIDKIVDDACADARVAFKSALDAQMEVRRTESWMWDWTKGAENAIPQARQTALSHALTDLVSQLDTSTAAEQLTARDR